MVRVLLILMLLPTRTPAYSQDRLTEQEFLRAISEAHPAFAELQEPVAVARAERLRASTWTNLGIAFEQEDPRGGAKQTTWSADWIFPFDGRRGLRSRAAESRVRAADKERLAESIRLRNEAREAYARWALASFRQRISGALLARVERLADQSAARAERGEESRLSARRLRLATLEVQATSARAMAEVLQARALATAWIPDLPERAEPERPELPIAPDSSLVSATPILEARRLDVERFELETRAARRFWDAPQLSFGWQRIEDSRQAIDGPVFGVSWTLPLFDRRQADRVEARGRLAAARARLELAERQTRAELAGVLAAYVHLRQAALEADGLVGESDQVIEAAVGRFRLGESNVTDLLETLRTVLAARETAIALYADALETHRALERAAGRPLTADGGSR